MAPPTFNIASWNVCGLCTPNRKWFIRNWLRQLPFPLSIVALQEIKADHFRLDVALRTILPDFQHISSAPNDGKGGTALLIHPDFTLRQSGIVDQGRAVWAQLEKDGVTFAVLNVYGPGSPRGRALLWNELLTTLPRDNWIICGDFNMTEEPADTTGGSNLLRGWELEAWRHLKVKLNLKDALTELDKVTGSRFTWRRRRGNTLEQSRIDRLYLGEAGWWLDGISELIHDGGQSLSDHDPIILRASLAPLASATPRFYTHFKAKAAILKQQQNLATLKTAWETRAGSETCPHRIWDTACKNLRRSYITIQKEPSTEEESTKALREDLRQLKIEMVDEFTTEALLEFSDKEEQLRDMEEAQALHMRQLSRIRWLGQRDEPSRFYFKTLKAKQKRETMSELLLDNDQLITDVSSCTPRRSPQRRHTNTLAWRGSNYYSGHTLPSHRPNSSSSMPPPPTEKELKDVLDLLPNDKAPGIDGLTAKVFKACWDFIREDLLAMVLDFWATGTLAHCIKEGVLKLIPKKADKRRFKDWRPLTMLTTIYKLIAKIIALRIKVFLPRMIAPQQTGFIPGRHILENISVAWLTMDWIKAKRLPSIFLKLDFEKAFDRVHHGYLWETLRCLGFSPHLVSLIQSLLTDAYSRVHINGTFSPKIHLLRGVCQGCPLSPLLFVMATQPLMTFLNDRLHSGHLQGIQITEHLTISYRLFADDLGVFIPATEQAFLQLKEALALYELATGARLNFGKTTIIPLALQPPPL
ncbi:unnamed protein product [Calypogeia fissa]